MKPGGDRTEILFKTLLDSADVEEQFENIINECQKNKTKYKDPEFYPQKSLTDEDAIELRDCEWRRIEDQYPTLFDNISPESVKQGNLGDCYFIISLIYASRHKDLVKLLFHPKSSLQYGVVLVYFWYLGEKIPVIVDTQVAYENSESENPFFSHPRTNEDSCWFVLVEKAYAKACGGYLQIERGHVSFGMHILFDFYSTYYASLEDIIPVTSLKEESEKKLNSNEKFFQILQNLISKEALIGTSCPDEKIENREELGLLTDQSYCILDARESDDQKFVKLRNPWGTGKYNGKHEWTEKLKRDLNYKDDDDDGSFWMLLENYLFYFTSISYSLPKEKNWKEMSVYGKIDGYLDGRSPTTKSPHVGCIPQWSIKFTKKTIVRLSFDVAGPESSHGIYIVKNHSQKVDVIYVDTEMMRASTNSSVNGIEYKVNDFSEPFTFFLTRSEAMDNPCYYRILIQSPDTDFVVKKFDDDFLKEKWNCVTQTGIFNDPDRDQWNPTQNQYPLTTCRQWFIDFPDLKNKIDSEIRFRVFKDISEGDLYLFCARTDKKLSYSYSSLSYQNFCIYSNSIYEEFSIQLTKNLVNDNETRFIFAFYRQKQTDVNKFKFQVLCKSKFEFGMLPEPDVKNNICYEIIGKLYSNDNDRSMPYSDSVECMKQWCLMFKKSPTTLFIEYESKETPSKHYVFLEKKEKPGQKIGTFYAGTTNFDFNIQENCLRSRETIKIEDASKPYALCVTRDPVPDKTSSFSLKIYGTEDFELFEIDGDKLGKKINKVVCDDDVDSSKDVKIYFPEVEFIEQPVNFHPKKSSSIPKKNSEKFKENLKNNPFLNLTDNDDKEKSKGKTFLDSIIKPYSNAKNSNKMVDDDNEKPDYVHINSNHSDEKTEGKDNIIVSINVNNENKSEDISLSIDVDEDSDVNKNNVKNETISIDVDIDSSSHHQKADFDTVIKENVNKLLEFKNDISRVNENKEEEKKSSDHKEKKHLKSKQEDSISENKEETENDKKKEEEASKSSDHKKKKSIKSKQGDSSMNESKDENENDKNKQNTSKINESKSETKIDTNKEDEVNKSDVSKKHGHKKKRKHKHKHEENIDQEEKSSDNIKREESDMTPGTGRIEAMFDSESFSVPNENQNLYQNELSKKNNKLLNKAISYLQDHGILFTEIDEVTMEKAYTMKKYVFVLSLYSVIILEKSKNSKKISKKEEKSLIDLHSISIINNDIIRLEFNEKRRLKKSKIVFQIDDPDPLIDSLNENIIRILTPYELRRINLINMILSKSQFKCTSHSILDRFISTLSIKKIKLGEKLNSKIFQLLFSHSNSVVLMKIKSYKKIFNIFSSSILIDKYINQIDIVDPESIIPLIMKNIDYFNNILHVKVKGSDSEDLQNLIEKMESVNSISFHDHPIDSFNYLSLLMEKNKIKSIGFDSSLTKSSLNSFLQIPNVKNLNYLRISNLHNFPISSLISYLTRLSYLSLNSCNLSIGNVLEKIIQSQMVFLKELDLSGNLGNEFELKAKKKLFLPLQLNALYVDNVQWEIDQLIFFMKLCSNSNLSLLSMNKLEFINITENNKKKGKSRVGNDPDEYKKYCWESFFNQLPSKMNLISSLNWNSNKLNAQFVSFLVNSIELRNVSFSSCNCSDLKFVKEILVKSYIEKVNIQKVSCIEKDDYLLNFKEFLLEIPQMKSLRQIDFTHNEFNKECFDVLAESLVNSEVNFVGFDDSKLSGFHYLLNFLKKLEKSKKKPIEVSYPILDIQRLEMNQTEIDEMTRYLTQLRKENSEREISSFEVFPEVSFLQLDHSFPEFMPKESRVQRGRYVFDRKISLFSDFYEKYKILTSDSYNSNEYFSDINNRGHCLNSVEEQPTELNEIEEKSDTKNDIENDVKNDNDVDHQSEIIEENDFIENEEVNDQKLSEKNYSYSEYNYSQSGSYSSDDGGNDSGDKQKEEPIAEKDKDENENHDDDHINKREDYSNSSEDSQNVSYQKVNYPQNRIIRKHIFYVSNRTIISKGKLSSSYSDYSDVNDEDKGK